MKITTCLMVTLAVTAVAAVLLWPLDRTSFAVDTLEVEDEISVVLEGCRNAAESVQSGKGQVTVYSRNFSEDGSVSESDATNTVAFSGNKFKTETTSKLLKNVRWTPLPTGTALVAPGTVRTEKVAYDGEKAVWYLLDTNQAFRGDESTNAGRHAFSNYMHVKVVNYVLMDIGNFGNIGPGVSREPPRIVGREVLNGSECIVVEVLDYGPTKSGGTSQNWFRFWVDPQKGFTVPQVQVWAQGGPYQEKTLLVDLEADVRQYTDSLWGPAKVTMSGYAMGRETGEYYKRYEIVTTYASDLQINVPISEEELTLTLPSGTKVTDELLEETYTVP
ncbi:MAG: hypothetical protein GTO55_09470 [Armatimonadetes bacterium]|nr:hypothetical protein [Armatimonadota bacterium]NIM24476.1 hypothetical protein [Armatimonadota bacterium]NIM68347.1 hypothetical protein [Armatimonadota bacterium]NIM76751.1 hypothetical protein [Armatimonadota bacterium]NIN06550.1 hypothetical protein [Armatimonadota bacterium]